MFMRLQLLQGGRACPPLGSACTLQASCFPVLSRRTPSAAGRTSSIRSSTCVW
ncbi:hypothetical protein PICMEDRAFT_14872 [Pichia membranifaciens NRRL Y-2026]|uniref:Uncharacterized protein n=1 Tax=Pichia membranifaciens NRRL Y-2026 TaxID=763406 RepID=A0A1E3NV41_9ASCO|nr:hypothetical protein PICMEDRAFT_14872 [Pichia membranifaciens NRRL Y-2026]ODQ49413.1 hypothetical protein PICMEDRAFT_14872 [Pichia membranifaciens NRRL Y-2026]